MPTRSGPRELAEEVGQAAREAAGKVRRMIVSRTNSAIYQVTGHRLLDDTIETRDAEVFAGVGFASRPSSSGDVEAIVAYPGGRGAKPAIIAHRQEGVRRVVAADLAADETQIHNSTTIARVTASGHVELRSSSGVAQRLVRGETYRSAEDTMLTALGDAMTVLVALHATIGGTYPADPATVLALTNAAAAVTAFKLAASTYLTTVAKAE